MENQNFDKVSQKSSSFYLKPGWGAWVSFILITFALVLFLWSALFSDEGTDTFAWFLIFFSFALASFFSLLFIIRHFWFKIDYRKNKIIFYSAEYAWEGDDGDTVQITDVTASGRILKRKKWELKPEDIVMAYIGSLKHAVGIVEQKGFESNFFSELVKKRLEKSKKIHSEARGSTLVPSEVVKWEQLIIFEINSPDVEHQAVIKSAGMYSRNDLLKLSAFLKESGRPVFVDPSLEN